VHRFHHNKSHRRRHCRRSPYHRRGPIRRACRESPWEGKHRETRSVLPPEVSIQPGRAFISRRPGGHQLQGREHHEQGPAGRHFRLLPILPVRTVIWKGRDFFPHARLPKLHDASAYDLAARHAARAGGIFRNFRLHHINGIEPWLIDIILVMPRMAERHARIVVRFFGGALCVKPIPIPSPRLRP
jgi:hypothetical protein